MATPNSARLTLIMAGKTITFLCDSGACRTVLREQDMTSTVRLSGERVVVRSASGHLETEPYTDPIVFEDPQTGKTAQCQIIVSKTCPINLLGRDVMCGLGIGVVPTTYGLKPIRVSEQEGEGLIKE